MALSEKITKGIKIISLATMVSGCASASLGTSGSYIAHHNKFRPHDYKRFESSWKSFIDSNYEELQYGGSLLVLSGMMIFVGAKIIDELIASYRENRSS